MNSQNDQQSAPTGCAGIAYRELAPGGQLAVAGMRLWLVAASERIALNRLLVPQFHAVGCLDAVPMLDEVMSLLSLAALRCVCIRAPNATCVSQDEQRLLQVFRALSLQQPALAATHLQPLMGGALARNFLRAATELVRCITASGCSLAQRPTLTLVVSQELPRLREAGEGNQIATTPNLRALQL